MASIDLERSAFSDGRFQSLMMALGLSRAETVGILLCLWIDTQEKEIITAPGETLVRYIGVKFDSREKVFEELVKNDYLVHLPNGQYEVRGNRKRVVEAIQLREKRRQAGSMGAKATNMKRWKEKAQNTVSKIEETPVILTADRHLSANDRQTSANVGKPSAKPPQTAKSTPLWEAYRQEYLERWGHEPKRDAIVNSQLCAMLRSFNEEESVKIIKHYFLMKDAFYLKNFHPIGAMVKNRHQIYASMTTGKEMTRASVQRYEKGMVLQDTLTAIQNGEI